MKRKLTNYEHLLDSLGISKIWLPLFAILFLPMESFTQCTINTPDCTSAPNVCLPVSGTMGPINNSGAIPGCGGGFSFHNTSWFEIIVNSSSVSVTITPSNCQNGAGIQAGLYEECDPTSPNLGVQCSCTTGAVTFSGGTVVGETYYIMIDGCSGDVCDYDITLTGGEIDCMPSGPLGFPDPPTPDVTEICPGTQVTFMTNVVPGADDYIWNFPPGTVILSQDCNMATVIWGSNGGPVTVTAWNMANPSGNTSLPTFIDLPTYEGFDGGEYCFPDDPGWFHPGSGTYYPSGDFDIPMMTAAGCDSIVHVSVIERTSPINVVYEQICEGSATCPIGGVVIDQTVAGIQLLLPGMSAFGCDSLIIATVDVIANETAIMEPDTLNCETLVDGVPLIAEPVPGGEYLWDTNDGNIVGPNDELVAYADQPGTYIVYVTITGLQGDVCGVAPICYASDTVEVIADFSYPEVATDGVDPTCTSNTDGSVSVSVTNGGQPPFDYLWDDPNASTSSTVPNLPPGVYHVTVTGSNGCAAVDSVEIAAPSAVVVDIADTTHVSCFNDTDGNISLDVMGGTTPYSYSWSHNGSLNSNTASNLSAGNYLVTVTDDNGCSIVLDIDIDQPAELMASGSTQNADCNSGNNGSASITVTGGVPPYSYAWPPGSGSGNVANNLPAGTYVVTVTDDNDCSEEVNLVIDEPTALNVSEDVVQDVSCNGQTNGSASINTSGGTAPYTYAWSNGQTTANATNLAAGSYTVVVTDANDCTEELTIDVAEPAAIALSEDSVSDVLCNGENNGSAAVSANGGTAPYTYTWTGGLTGATQNNLTAGMYTVVVEDDNGCTQSIDIEIQEPPVLTLTELPSTDVACNGGNNGSASVMGNGGTPPYDYDWSSGNTGANVNGLPAGIVTVTLTDDNGCTESLSITINEPTALSLTEDVVTDATCEGLADGEATVSASGGTAPYTFDWDNGASGATVNGLAANDYEVTVTDAQDCTEVLSITVNEPDAIDLQEVDNQDASCAGNADGAATVSASGGTAPYSFLWSDGQSGATNTALPANTHEVTVTDANGCTESINIIIDEPAAMVLSEQNVTDALCDGSADGTATVTTSGGNTPYSYAWSDGQSGATATGLTAGIYQVTVTDDEGCTDEISVTINQPTTISLVEVSQQDVGCNGGDDGSASVSASGGSAPYTYQWSTGQIGANASNLSAGTVIATVTDDNGCTEEISITIDEPPVLTISMDTQQDANCNSAADGSASVVANGGTAPYTFAWSNGQTGATASGLAADTYTAVVTDANGCTAEVDITVDEPNQLEAAASGTDALCNGGDEGTASASATGGTPPYSYQWDDINAQATAVATDLAAGNYIVIITDALGCTATANVSITEPTAIQATADATDALCSSSTDGTATVSASGGTVPYTYQWPNGQTTITATNLPVGQVIVEVTDANGCMTTASATVAAPSAISVQLSAEDALCNAQSSGSASVVVSGGTPPYNYAWSDSQGQATATADNLSAGNYIVTVTDANGCTIEDNINVGEPAEALAIQEESITQATCGAANGSVDISVTGGTLPYSYAWSDGSTNEDPSGLTPGNIVATVTDANGCTATATFNVSEPNALNISQVNSSDVLCNSGADGSINITTIGGTPPYTFLWNTGATSEDIDNLVAGDYDVVATDADGCTFTAAVTINEPAAITATIIPTMASCGLSDGSISLTVNGGTMPYSYVWSNGTSGQDPDQLAAGDYDVVITDANGCTFTTSTTVENPNPPVISFTSTDVNCFAGADGSVDLTVTGGSQPYNFQWSDPSLNGIGDHNTLTAGNYVVTVIDRDNCTAELSFSITEPAAALTITQAGLVQATCGNANGSIDIDITGGTAPYTFLWSNGATTEDNTNLTPGVYSPTVTDANGCTATQDFNVSEPNALQITDVASTDVSCNGGSDGLIDVSTAGGSTPYIFSWDSGAGTEDISNLPAGDYNLTITDNDGCTVATQVTIGEPEVLTATAEPSQASCGMSDGSINLIPEGGTRPYTFQWAHGATSEDPVGLQADTYIVTITDANGCTFELDAEVINPNSPQISIASFSNVNCNGGTDGIVNLNITGGSGTYNIEWSDPDFNGQQNPTTLPAGMYTILVTDTDNCTDTETIEITEPDALALVVDEIVQATCGEPNGSVSVTISGGTTPYSYAWSGGAGTNEDATNLVPGDYTLTVTDANGCEYIESFGVTEPNALQANGTANAVSCNGGANGSIDIDVMGGTPPYLFLWDNGETTEDITDLIAGNYVLVITDNDGCTFSITRLVEEPTPVEITGTAQQAICNLANGSIDITVSGGTSPYTYDWDDPNVADIEDPTGLFAGTYNVTVTDANGCTEVFSQAVTTPNGLEVSVIATDALCFGDANGNVDATIVGGVPPHTFAWSNSATTEDINALPQGTYTITVTDDEGCTVTATATVNQPDALIAEVLAPLNASCNGSADGSLDLQVTGGVAPYTYLWNNGAGMQEDPTGLAAGTYIVTVTDANGCTYEEEAVIEEPTALELIINTADADCNGSSTGSLSSTVNGGTPPYSYDWSGVIDDVANPENVPAGTFTLVVTDANGCDITSSATVGQPAAIQIQITDQSDNSGFNITCADAEDGYVQVTATGGNTPFSYNWNNGATGDRVENLGVGTYEVIVTDSKGCTQALSVSMTAPAPMIVSTQQVDPTCFGDGNGFIFVENVTGGSGPYLYSFDGGPFTASPQFTNLQGGSYEVAIQDANGCEWTDQFEIIEPTELEITLGGDEEIELGESFTIMPQANSTNFDFEWTKGAYFDDTTRTSYQMIVAPPTTTVYEIEITDDKGCRASDLMTIYVSKDRPVFIPNAFTPDGDGINDFFQIFAREGIIRNVKRFSIYDRWGEIVFHRTDFMPLTNGDDTDNGWNGRLNDELMNPAVFIYIAEIEFIDDTVEMYSGDVTLVGKGE